MSIDRLEVLCICKQNIDLAIKKILYMLDERALIDLFPINTSIRESRILQPVPSCTVDFVYALIAISLHSHRHRHRPVPTMHNWTDDVDLRICSTKCQRSTADDARILFVMLLVRAHLSPDLHAENNN